MVARKGRRRNNVFVALIIATLTWSSVQRAEAWGWDGYAVDLESFGSLGDRVELSQLLVDWGTSGAVAAVAGSGDTGAGAGAGTRPIESEYGTRPIESTIVAVAHAWLIL